MKGVCIKLYTYEFKKHQNTVLYEWLLEFAKKNGIHGGSVFRAIAGFGRDGIIHEEHFFELGSNMPLEVSLTVSKEEAERFLKLLKAEGVDLFYCMYDVEYGMLHDL